jgi:F-type H+-transporting ATPase subunit delta
VKTTRRARRAARQLFRLCLADGVVDERRVRRVAQYIAASGRRDALAVLLDFHRLVRLDRDRHTALVQSASPLPDDVRRDVEAGLAHIYGSGLETSFEQNPALIGGMRIRVASDVYDGTVLARLIALEARL